MSTIQEAEKLLAAMTSGEKAQFCVVTPRCGRKTCPMPGLIIEFIVKKSNGK